jgi:CO/xanthine dehydrogenase FAD-binding subunit
MISTTKVYRPNTLKDACTVLAASSSQIINGGTCFFPALKDRPASRPLIDLSCLNELKVIQIADDGVRIGGTATWSEIATAELPPQLAALKQAARRVGSFQIQNVATLAGNLCNASLAADGVPPLLTLDAEVELASSADQRRIRLANFIVGDRKTLRRRDEILTAIIVPHAIDPGVSAFLKLGARRFLAPSIVMVAAVVEQDAWGRVSQARVAVGSCSPVAQRLPKLERRLVGERAELGLGDVAEEADLAALSPGDDVQATAAYRRDAALTLVRRAIDACIGVGG